MAAQAADGDDLVSPTTSEKKTSRKQKSRGKRKQRRVQELGLDERLAKALNHPIRTEILAKLGGGKTMSAVELEPLLGKPMTKVAYHCRVLLKYECVEVVKREQVRGAVKTKYRATTRMLLDGDNWERLSRETRNGISINAVGEVLDRASDAIEADTLDKRSDRAVVTFRMAADEKAWQKASAIVRDAYERLSEVEADAANRDGDKFCMTVSLLCYESPSDDVSAAAS